MPLKGAPKKNIFWGAPLTQEEIVSSIVLLAY